MRIDLNCDMGESYHDRIIGCDDAIMPYVTSCNIACGGHGGDNETIIKTIKLAMQNGVRIGAHPSYPDLENFGRIKLEMDGEALFDSLVGQLTLIQSLTISLGGILHYVKAHGALYNSIADDENEALIFLNAVSSIDSNLSIMGLPDSMIERLAKERNFNFIREGFIDRAYTGHGRLTSRNIAGSVHQNTGQVVQQFLDIVLKKKVISIDAEPISMSVNSICIHGDHPMALEFAEVIHKACADHNIKLDV